MNSSPIGFFDSGSGGLSVLNIAREIMPREDFVYFGDNKNSPYGTKSTEEIIALSTAAVRFLISKNVKAILIACNTATSVAVELLRRQYSLPIFSMEPAVKPALKHLKNGRIVIMATPQTLSQERFLSLVCGLTDKERIFPLPCPGLVEILDKGELESKAITEYLNDRIACTRDVQTDAVVLGCTHYVFIEDQIARAFRDMGMNPAIVDGNRGTCMHVKSTLEKMEISNLRGSGHIDFYTSAEESVYLPIFEKLTSLKKGDYSHESA